MNKFIFKVIILILTFMTSLTASGGKAIIPFWSGNTASGVQTFFNISNITNNNILVTIKFYDKDGKILSPSSFSNFQNENTQIAPKASSSISIKTPTSNSGFGIIEWQNIEGDDDTVALVSHGIRTININGYRADVTIPINNGQPF